jgi:hypothetical protein
VALCTVPNQPVFITSSLSSLSSGTNPLPPHVGHLCSLSVPFSITPSPLQSGHVFWTMWTPSESPACGLTTTHKKKSRQQPKQRLPIGNGLCRNIGLNRRSALRGDGGSGFVLFLKCGPRFFTEEQVAPTSLGIENKIGAMLSWGPRAARFYHFYRLTIMKVF